MVHLTNTSRSATFLLGTAVLMLFFFCAPMHAQTPTFKSTSSYRIANPNYSAQQLDPTTIGHQTYRSTIYTPFGSSTPSSNNNPGGNNDSGSGTDDDDIGIPGWADTPSEPLPIGDGIGILLLMATMMVGAIFLKQRKQLSESISKSTTSTTNINNSRGNQLPTALKKENTTTHMTTRKQTYQSLRQKLFLLLAFICIAGNTFAWKPIMIGHRGSRSGVENTKEAFINGIKNHGFKALECDVKVTADKKYICWHDDNIANSIVSNRDFDVSIYTNNLAGLQGLTLAQSRKNTITGTTTQYTGVICTLQEFLQICKDYNVTPIVEIKYNLLNIKSDGSDFSGLSDIYNIIANLDMLDKTVVLGTETMMEYYKNNHPNIQRMWLTNSITDAHITRCQELGCWIDSQPYLYYDSEKPANNKAITAAQIKKCQNAGVKVGLWTLNGTSSYNTYGAMGPNFITSDDNVVKDLPDLTGTDPNAPTTDKTIYFRPSTTNFTKGYTNRTTKGKDAGWDNVYWAKNGRLTASVHGNLKGSIFLDYGQTKNNTELIATPTSRFIPITVPTGYTGVIAYRIGSMTEPGYNTWKNSSGAQGVTNTENTDISNTIPKFTNTVTEIPAPEPIPTDGKNLLCNREGWWDVWYWAYYLPTTNTVTMYFANTSDWENVKLVTGKDIYTHETVPTTATIPNTKLSYFNLNGKEFGYEYYGFSGNGTTWDNSKTIPVVGGAESNWVYDESSSHANNKLDAAKKSNANQNRIANRIKYANNRTGLLGNLLKGANLYIPGAQDAKPTHKTLSSWQDLNHEQTIKIEGVGNVNYYAHQLKSATDIKTIGTDHNTATVTFDAAYTSTVILRAYDNVSGYKFIGWFEEGSNTPIVADASELYEETKDGARTVVYKYMAPNAPKTIVARYDAYVSKQFRIQSFKNNGDATIDNNDWEDWTTTPSNYSVNIKYTDVASGLEVSNTYNKKPSDSNRWYNINYIKSGAPLVLTADENQTEYTFIGWWNSGKGQFADNPMTMENPEDYEKQITARFAIIKPQTISVQTYDTSKDTYMPSVAGGSVTISYHEGITSPTVSVEPTGTYNALCGSPVALTATPSAGYSFVGWYEGQNLVSKDVTYTYNATEARNITAHFVEGIGTTTLQVRAMKWNGSQLVKSVDGGTFTLTHSGGVVYAYQEQASDYHPVLVANSPATFQATINDGYEFIGWFNSSKGPFLDNPWIMLDPSKRDAYDITVSAAFAHQDYANKQTIKIEGPGTVTANYTYYNTSTREITIEQNSSFIAWTGKRVTLTANPLAGYKFDGWYDENGSKLSENSTYFYDATSARTITAKFVSEVNKLTVSVLNYNTSYNEFREYEYEYNKIALTGGGKSLESYSSFSCEFKDATEVTLTATPESEEETGYDFVGWYQNNTLLSKEETISVNVIGLQAISAHFAPKKCHKLTLVPNSGGTYTVHYGKDKNTYPNNFYSVESSLTDTVITYTPFYYYYTVSSAKPILGYKFKHHDASPLSTNENYWENFGTFHNNAQEKSHNVVVSFVREEDQVVYLDLNGQWDRINYDNYWVYAYDTTNILGVNDGKGNVRPGTYKWILMTEITTNSLYTCTIPRNTYSHIKFVQLDTSDEPTNPISSYSGQNLNHTNFFTIPATRLNCMKLKSAYNSSIGGYEDMWSEPPTEVGDFRLVYIEQTVESKDSITVDYLFDDAGLIKKKAGSQDIISLHIYNKVSDGIDGINNPEVILQRCTGFVDGKSQWVDIERYMVFGPLRSDKPGVIRMPGRRNAGATINYDNGIDAIKNDKDNGSGVWNFVIQQTIDNGNVTAKLLVNQTHRYTGDYYIRTTNAPGQYYQYTHPGNVMKLSDYAAANSDYSHYFIRYVDINEDGTPTAEAGKHPLVKFAIANDYSVYLNHEFMMTEERFKDDEYGVDKFVLDKGGAPNLPADASVRFGWDSVTNRLTRAYIANTTIKNNEYLVVEGTNIGSPQGNDTYFTDNSNWLYSIDLNATKDADNDAAAKVKAKMNGQYQYFMGSQDDDDYETLISGNGAGTYPIRLLYDFKDDRFTTIYRPSNTDISGTVTLETPVMIERKHNEAPTQIKFANNAKFVVNGNFDKPAYAVMTFLEEKLASKDITHHEKMFYWISFPFDVRISDVFGLGDYGKYWIMEEYNGAQRAASGLAQNNWKYITKKSAILEANKGYVLCLNYSQILQDQLFKSYGGSDKTLNSGKLSLYFPSNGVISPADITGEQTRTVELAPYENNNTAWNHHNWHIIGVPSFANPEFRKIQTNAPFVYQYWHPTDGYAAVSINDVEFQAMHAYMVQYHGIINWDNIVNTGDGSVTPSKLAAKTDEQADKNIMLRLELQQAGSTLDKTYVQLRNDKGTKGFDMSLDLTKIINAGANIYSIVDNHEMAGNAIPKDETVLPLGVVITAAGEYTFAMPQGTEGMIVELIDYEQGTSTNLLMSDYTVTLDKGTFNQRFALRLVPDKVATSVDDIGNGANGDKVRKLLIDGVLYLQQGTNTYDAQGKHIQ